MVTLFNNKSDNLDVYSVDLPTFVMQRHQMNCSFVMVDSVFISYPDHPIFVYKKFTLEL